MAEGSAYILCLITDYLIAHFSQVLKGAAVLQIECLQRRCEEFLCKNLTTSNCIARWRLAHWHACSHLRDQVSSRH